MTDLVSELSRFVPPARTYDKHVYSPWTGPDLNLRMRDNAVDTILITGGYTAGCALATALDATDSGFRVS